MSETEEDGVVIEYEDEIAEQPAPPKPERKVVSTDDLQSMLSRERQGREQAERRAQAAERDAERARGSVSTEIEGRYTAEMRAAEAGITGIAADIARLEQDALAADETGDRAAAFAALRKIARLEAQQLQAEAKRDWLRDNKGKILSAAQTSAPQAQSDQIDVSQYSAKQRAWIKDHPEYLTDPAFQQKVARAHASAIGDEIEVDSDEYFERINERVHGTQSAAHAQQTSAFSEAAETRPRAAAQMPAQRRVPGGPAPRGVIRLSAEEREAADIAFADMPPQERYKLYHDMKATNQ